VRQHGHGRRPAAIVAFRERSAARGADLERREKIVSGKPYMDTVVNVEATGEFVWNMATFARRQAAAGCGLAGDRVR
jgi:hypothetical protein